MDVFALREKVVSDYKQYIESFVRIRDERIDGFVQDELKKGALWPEAILQLNPAYEPGPTLDELAAQGVIVPGTARFFRLRDGKVIRLFHHQYEAIQIARRWEPFVVTTGTGSGKSLTYLIPIYDHILRNHPERHQVRAIIVYPMNALINSQFKALSDYAAQAGGSVVRFDKYTGQERDEERQRIQDDPPHILLTNYVMLEYMLLRPAERHFTDRATANLEFLVLDELHTYRGRQGADVAMLVRRVRERAGNPRMLHIGTSATMVSEGTRAERKAAAAEVATKLFGVELKPENVVDETLRRAIQVPAPQTAEALRAAVEAALPAETLEDLTSHPLAAWVEETFGIATEDGRLVRRKPVTFAEGVSQLSKASEVSESTCADRLQSLLSVGNRIQTEYGEPVFAFRLHQFLAAGGTVYTTLESSSSRYLTLQGEYYAPGGDGERLVYPLAFCRECGQEYYLVNLRKGAPDKLTPRLPLFDPENEEDDVQPGYFALHEDDLWSEAHEAELPDFWFDERRGERRIKRDYRPHVPARLRVKASGEVANGGGSEGEEGWFQPQPFLLCLRCGAAYDRTERNDFRKLTRLSHTGRSTATTLVSGSAIVQLREDPKVTAEARKILSFTDNRQDASLQAGHFNDFIQVALVRAALYKALSESGKLDHANITKALFQALALDQKAYAKEPAQWGPGKTRNEEAMQRLLEYRVYEDLRRGWRIVQPNLEQCGLVRIEYPGLTEMCGPEEPWRDHSVLRQATPETRETAVRAFLDHLRHEIAIDARVLNPEEHWELRKRVEQVLRDPWAFDEYDKLLASSMFLLPGSGPTVEGRERSLSGQSRIARYMRNRHTWGLPSDLSAKDGETLILALIAALRGQYLTQVPTSDGQRQGIQLMAASFEWRAGDGTPPPPDPVRTKRMRSERLEKVDRESNKFFARLYRETARQLAGVEGAAHTGQIPMPERQEREKRFGEGDLAALFCSPTMELGVDIRDLNVVHLRNIPPTPANYAQRSGRAGRGGQPALVMAFCSEGSPHDQYFFEKPDDMVAGAVAPARLDLGNQELVEAHIHSVWLAATGVRLGRGMVEVLDLQREAYPPNADIQSRLTLPPTKSAEVTEECKRILDAGGEEVHQADWNTPEWLDQTLRGAAEAFNHGFDRWRELYSAAERQRDEARRVVDNPTASRRERADAERREEEAKRQIDLLLNRSDESTESDFYPYRYLASEGFLPGYNFPRLPIRAIVPVGERQHVIQRPRFLALTEFGPRNVIYHEGRKYRMARCFLPPGGVEARLIRAKLCSSCGYFHDGEHALADRCDHCGVQLDGAHSQYIASLFEMTAVRGSRVERITCDEEERVREGFHITTHYRFSLGTDGNALQQKATATGADGNDILRLTHAPRVALWRVNHRWRRSEQNGFTLDKKTGYWARRPDDDDHAPDVESNDLLPGVRPLVRDTRNLLLLQPVAEDKEGTGDARVDEAFLVSLAYALQRGIQMMFQVEEQEIAVELIGEGNERRILLWEAAEGGTGVWPRLLGDPKALGEVATEALRVCHFDPKDRSDLAGNTCSHACYDCLLSYRNQLNHPLLSRHIIRDYLLALSHSSTVQKTAERTYDEQYAWLEERRDKNSTLEGEFLSLLYRTKRRLPDRAQYRPHPDVYAEADFYYEREGLPGVCVFCDGPDHDQPERKARDNSEHARLGDFGYRVIVIRYDQALDGQINAHADLFGAGL
jgi:ATP-dependent helicase YprA (DUF1998 family)